MLAKEFNFDKFRFLQEEKDNNLKKFLTGEKRFVPVIQRSSKAMYERAICRYRNKSLENQLDCLNDYFYLKSDFLFSYLEPWHGVGVYASAFGCPFIWYEHDAPQTLHIYSNLNEVLKFKAPNIKDCEVMNMILETIKYFRNETGGMLDISATDTQSPVDNASLIMDACEFFAEAFIEPEPLHPFMQSITDTIIEFTHMQQEVAGPALVGPGHIMPSLRGGCGIAISDDNLAIMDPKSYNNLAVPYNNQLSDEFSGIAVHSCGAIEKVMNVLLNTHNLTMIDCAVGQKVDPNPSDPEKIKEALKGSGVTLKARLRYDELHRLNHLIDKDIKLIVELFTEGTIDEKNAQWESAKEYISNI